MILYKTKNRDGSFGPSLKFDLIYTLKLSVNDLSEVGL